MKTLLLSSIILLISFVSNSQNLVLNGGFDSYITCPGFGQWSNTYINDWSKPSYGSSDYYNYNCPGIIPASQLPRSGDAYAGIICYNFGTEYREYITGMFSSPLQAGSTYLVKFYVSLNDGYIQGIREVGAYISAAAPGPFSNSLHIPVIPQVVNGSGQLEDTSAWMEISDIYTATGGENYITIGNFFNDTMTTISQPGSVGSFGAYYFVDDVSVQLVDTITGIQNVLPSSFEIKRVSKNLIELILTDSKNAVLLLYDLNGKKVAEYFPDQVTSIDLTDLAEGLYVGKVISGNYFRHFKIFK
jgi:OmpA-OmpF porin, OOP family